MFQLSLSSLELFHSNFLAWLFENHPTSLKILGLEPPEKCAVEREAKHIDLTISGDGQILAIIENKVKSLPDLAQLKRYNAHAPDHARKILLTLMPASFDAKSEAGWDELSYKSLSEKLKDWCAKETGLTPRDKEFIRAYQEMISTLSELVSLCFGLETGNSYWFKVEDAKLLGEIGFIDTIKKFHGQRLRHDIIEKIEEVSGLNDRPLNSDKLEKGQIGIFVDVAFFRKSPCVSIHVKKGGIDDYYSIQIQGHQYRRMIESNWSGKNLKGEARKTAILEHISAKGGFKWLFSEAFSDENNGRSFRIDCWHNKSEAVFYKTKMATILNAYYPTAIYQHIEIADEINEPESTEVKRLQHGDVITRAIEDLKYAIKLLD